MLSRLGDDYGFPTDTFSHARQAISSALKLASSIQVMPNVVLEGIYTESIIDNFAQVSKFGGGMRALYFREKYGQAEVIIADSVPQAEGVIRWSVW